MILRFLNWLFPHHRSTAIIRHYRWKPYDLRDEYFRDATSIYDIERRMREFLLPYC
jgi:hypothetical protein